MKNPLPPFNCQRVVHTFCSRGLVMHFGEHGLLVQIFAFYDWPPHGVCWLTGDQAAECVFYHSFGEVNAVYCAVGSDYAPTAESSDIRTSVGLKPQGPQAPKCARATT